MSGLPRHKIDLPWEQHAIRARCFHPTGTFIEFKKEEIDAGSADKVLHDLAVHDG